MASCELSQKVMFRAKKKINASIPILISPSLESNFPTQSRKAQPQTTE